MKNRQQINTHNKIKMWTKHEILHMISFNFQMFFFLLFVVAVYRKLSNDSHCNPSWFQSKPKWKSKCNNFYFSSTQRESTHTYKHTFRWNNDVNLISNKWRFAFYFICLCVWTVYFASNRKSKIPKHSWEFLVRISDFQFTKVVNQLNES